MAENFWATQERPSVAELSASALVLGQVARKVFPRLSTQAFGWICLQAAGVAFCSDQNDSRSERLEEARAFLGEVFAVIEKMDRDEGKERAE